MEGEGWRRGSYVCRCHQSHYAFKEDWNNSVHGYDAESKSLYRHHGYALYFYSSPILMDGKKESVG